MTSNTSPKTGQEAPKEEPGEAIELQEIGSVRHSEANRPSTSTPRHVHGKINSICTFWRRHVAPRVPHDGCRDHFALERTFLGYLRTSLVLVMLGVALAQLFRLQHNLIPDQAFGFHNLGIPLASVYIGTAILVLLLGAFRFWRQQNAILRGKIHAGGAEIMIITSLLIALSIILFVVIIAVDSTKG